ncbi:unnamed protein product, partial [Prorocentrum cordatum]
MDIGLSVCFVGGALLVSPQVEQYSLCFIFSLAGLVPVTPAGPKAAGMPLTPAGFSPAPGSAQPFTPAYGAMP